eukprot:gene11282-23600_t
MLNNIRLVRPLRLCYRFLSTSSKLSIKEIQNEQTGISNQVDQGIYANSYGNLALYYHNSVIRTVHGFDSKDKNDTLSIICSQSKEIMKYMKDRMHKLNGRRIGSINLPIRIQKYRDKAVANIPRLLSDIRSDSDLRAIGACLVVLMPYSSALWTTVDNKFAQLVASETFGIECCLLAAHACVQARHQYGWKNMKLATVAAIQKRLQTPPPSITSTLTTGTTGGTIDEGSGSGVGVGVGPPSWFLLPENTANMTTTTTTISATSNSADNIRVEHNAAIDYIGLLLETLSVRTHTHSQSSNDNGHDNDYGHATASSTATATATALVSNHALLSSVCELCLLSLSLRSPSSPVKLSSLRLVWEKASLLDLPNSYCMYKELFDQVYLSISADPLQLAYQEEAVVSLLEAMSRVHFKHSKLIQKITEIMQRQGFDKSNTSALVQHDSIPFAFQTSIEFNSSTSGGRFRVLREAVDSDVSGRMGTLFQGKAVMFGISEGARVKAAELLR